MEIKRTQETEFKKGTVAWRVKEMKNFNLKHLAAGVLIIALICCLTACKSKSELPDEPDSRKSWENSQSSDEPSSEVSREDPEEPSSEVSQEDSEEPIEDYKPVIYLYPQTRAEITVKLDYAGELTCTYPAYGDGWTVWADPDGTLTDADGQTYNYLYWEGRNSSEYDFSKGFCVAGSDTADFLEDALSQLGLTRREANEFIVFWLPQMEDHAYNLISFQSDVYTQAAQLSIDPAPDTLIRVFMAWKPLEEAVDIPAQELTAPERIGFTVVEWGGSQGK